MTTETTETPLETARRLLPWGTTVYTITRSSILAASGRPVSYITPLVVTEDSSIVDLTDTLAALGFERRSIPGIRIEGPERDSAADELVTRISEAIHDDPAELMHEQL